ncbi:MAG: hypothetical protein EA342_03045 [Leptolyngbya sp. LCM1.Bin17]|nr:MAG: hypothetical protein EA342_03045 [Leptolyngbya sp. LCM1.Bin17]
MTFFNSSQPLVRRKQTQLDIQDLEGLIRWRWQINQTTLMAWLYTRIDQVFLLWGWLAGIIFLTPQFFPSLSWHYQALVWSVLTVLAIGLMAKLAWFWVTVEQLRWLVYLWGGLMLLGLGLTDYGILVGSGAILMRLCPIWLTVCALGYGAMGVGMRSRTFLLFSLLHGAAMPVLPLAPSYQFLTTGLVIAGSLFALAEVQWDMRPPLDSEVLTPAQQAFNREQRRLRSCQEQA